MHTELMDDLVAALCQSMDRNEQWINLTCKSTFTFTFFAFAVHSGDASVNKIKDDVCKRSVGFDARYLGHRTTGNGQ
jgi:hypothetical protein